MEVSPIDARRAKKVLFLTRRLIGKRPVKTDLTARLLASATKGAIHRVEIESFGIEGPAARPEQ
jgi:hypothetical protein